MLRGFQLATMIVIGAAAMVRPAEARVDIRVNLASQTMEVASSEGTYVWPISSARFGYRTPHGSFGIQRMEVMHRSHKYHNSPMPHSLFFSGGYAIHGTYETASLGRPASHGCIRIAPDNAAALYEMVAAEGGRISIVGDSPAMTRYARHNNGRYAVAHRAFRNRSYARRPTDDDAYPALGYAPAAGRSFQRWLDDPTDN